MQTQNINLWVATHLTFYQNIDGLYSPDPRYCQDVPITTKLSQIFDSAKKEMLIEKTVQQRDCFYNVSIIPLIDKGIKTRSQARMQQEMTKKSIKENFLKSDGNIYQPDALETIRDIFQRQRLNLDQAYEVRFNIFWRQILFIPSDSSRTISIIQHKYQSFYTCREQACRINQSLSDKLQKAIIIIGSDIKILDFTQKMLYMQKKTEYIMTDSYGGVIQQYEIKALEPIVAPFAIDQTDGNKIYLYHLDYSEAYRQYFEAYREQSYEYIENQDANLEHSDVYMSD